MACLLHSVRCQYLQLDIDIQIFVLSDSTNFRNDNVVRSRIPAPTVCCIKGEGNKD